MKKIATIQDISCIGKCSLTVALPILSAMGIETAVIPTAVLSTHTAFDDFTFRDLTSDIGGILDHWKKEGFSFDAVYSGYLGSPEQIDLVRRTWKEFSGPETLHIVDPAMADNGSLYKGFTQAFADEMARLCGEADLIMPNLTEAALMTHSPYRPEGGRDYIQDMLRRLAELGSRYSMLTGVSPEPDRLGAMIYDSRDNIFYEYYNEKLPVKFHGTGDIFASCMAGGMTIGKGLEESMAIAVDYTLECIRATTANAGYNWYGVDFETAIPYLVRRIGK